MVESEADAIPALTTRAQHIYTLIGIALFYTQRGVTFTVEWCLPCGQSTLWPGRGRGLSDVFNQILRNH